MKEKFKIFFGNVRKESDETKEAFGILQKRIKGETVSDVDKSKLKEQLFDILKITIIGIPFILIPGASIVFPIIIYIARKHKIELLPSSFKEKNNEK